MSPVDTKPLTEADLEELAAYVEDRLDASARARVEARVARDDAYAELLADAALAWDDDEDDAIPAEREPAIGDLAEDAPVERIERFDRIDRPARRRRWPSGGRALALAASLVLAVALVWLVRPTVGPATEWSDGLSSAAVLADERWGTNGLPRERGLESAADAFSLGVLWEDLTVATRVAVAADEAEAMDAAVVCRDEWATVARAVGMGEPATHLIDRWGDDRLAAVTSTRSLVLDALAIRRRFGDDLETAFTTGRWAESVRLWALAGDLDTARRVWRRQPDLDGSGIDESTLGPVGSVLATGSDAAAVELAMRRWIAEQTGGFVP